MAKLTKDDLKSIVKECLIEILAEGLVGNSKKNLNEKRILKKQINQAKNRSILKESRLSGTSFSNESNTRQNDRFSYLDNIKLEKVSNE